MSLSTYCPLGKSSSSTTKGGPDPTKVPLLFLPHHLDSHSSTFRFSGTFSSGQFIQRENVGHDAVGLISSERSALHLMFSMDDPHLLTHPTVERHVSHGASGHIPTLRDAERER